MINSQRGLRVLVVDLSISKGMGDQFSARRQNEDVRMQYIKGDG